MAVTGSAKQGPGLRLSSPLPAWAPVIKEGKNSVVPLFAHLGAPGKVIAIPQVLLWAGHWGTEHKKSGAEPCLWTSAWHSHSWEHFCWKGRRKASGHHSILSHSQVEEGVWSPSLVQVWPQVLQTGTTQLLSPLLCGPHHRSWKHTRYLWSCTADKGGHETIGWCCDPHLCLFLWNNWAQTTV